MESKLTEDIIRAIGRVVLIGTKQPLRIQGILKSVWDHKSGCLMLGITNPEAVCPGYTVKLGVKLYIKNNDIEFFGVLSNEEYTDDESTDIVDSSFSEDSTAEDDAEDNNNLEENGYDYTDYPDDFEEIEMN